MIRTALTDYRLSNGVVIPAGTSVVVPMYATHHDEAIWPDPYTFDPYRAARLQESDGGGGDIKRLVKASPDFLAWGYGKHAWYAAVDHVRPCIRRAMQLIVLARRAVPDDFWRALS